MRWKKTKRQYENFLSQLNWLVNKHGISLVANGHGEIEVWSADHLSYPKFSLGEALNPDESDSKGSDSGYTVETLPDVGKVAEEAQ